MSSFYLQRAIHTTCVRLLPRIPKKANPGVGYQVQEFGEAAPLEADPEGFGDIESDFMTAHHAHREHEKDVQRERDRIRQLMIKHKYFRDQKLPNLLTYAEKEQIRLLHARDAEEWTPERLAESFPATPDIINKLLRAKWRPRATKRIRDHDEAVIRNWEVIRTGQYETPIPPELLAHLRKFAERKHSDLETEVEKWPTRLALPKPTTNEFQSLITSCKKYADNKKVESQKMLSAQEPPIGQPNDEETYLLDKVHDKRKMRLQELKALKLKTSPTDLENGRLEQTAVESLKNPSGTGIVPKEVNEKHSPQLPNFISKFENNEIVISADDQRRFEMTRVKDHIHIPRKVWKKGATYRVEDSYYDDDGEFLYRVPGMTGKK